MTLLGNRILDLRRKKNWSQNELAKMLGITYAHIGRYETKGTQPSAEVLKKIASALDTTTDYLMYGDKDEKARATLKDTELLQQLKEKAKMSNEDKKTIKNVIDAFIKRSKLNQMQPCKAYGSSLTDNELLNQFKTIEKLPGKNKSVVKIFLDALYTKGKLKQLAI